jgi:hypothetical protein
VSDHELAAPVAGSAHSYPVIGDTARGLGEYLVKTEKLRSLDDYARVRNEALSILRHCHPFSEKDGTKTGLVVGYVQSGKTLSMTTVSALARDNGCRIIILLAGVTTNLLQQNANRFKKDLRAATGKAAWRISNSQDGLGEANSQGLEQAVAEWRSPSLVEMDKQTFLYLVLKNHSHLDRLHKLLASVKLAGIPALILDDEADQAGLNTSPSAPDGSTTYQKIAKVRACLPHHTYLQYTATPQAPLLIALDDMLSPAFAELVEPGAGYTGGQAFFGKDATPGLVKSIPATDLFKPGEPPEEPPDSLLEALRIFFVGCAVASSRGRPTPRSMLVHPSPRTADHTRYMGWVAEIIKRWAYTLREDPDARDELLKEFRDAYDDLSQTDRELPAFDGLVQRLQVSLGRVSLKEVNSQDGSEIDWENADDHVLVGGEKLNRGFTVEGLTVTYMPRDAGDWNADTIQQRARFFGYKEHYLNICRLFLHADVIHAYRSYVTHEQDVRRQLAEHRGRPLREWRRAFFLNAKMKPTRRNVLADPFYRVAAGKPWFLQKYPHTDTDAAAANLLLFDSLERKYQFAHKKQHHPHSSVELPLTQIFDELLEKFKVGGGDVPAWYAQLVTIRDILDNNLGAQALLVRMSNDKKTRMRSTTDGAIRLHQGRSSGRSADSYRGDSEIRDAYITTIQMHRVNVSNSAQSSPRQVAALAIHIPSDLWKDDVVAQ